mgnify:CR=1 FL=1
MIQRVNNTGADQYKVIVNDGGDIILSVGAGGKVTVSAVSYTHLRAHET